MKFSLKVFFSTLLVATIVFSIGCFLIISNVFDTALDRETRLAVEENQMLRLSFENAGAGAPSPVTLNAARRIMQALEYDSDTGRYLRLMDLGRSILYSSAEFPGETPQLSVPAENQRIWQLASDGSRWFVLTVCQVSLEDRSFCLESVRDITHLFAYV